MCKINASMLLTAIRKPVPYRLKHPPLIIANSFVNPTVTKALKQVVCSDHAGGSFSSLQASPSRTVVNICRAHTQSSIAEYRGRAFHCIGSCSATKGAGTWGLGRLGEDSGLASMTAAKRNLPLGVTLVTTLLQLLHPHHVLNRFHD